MSSITYVNPMHIVCHCILLCAIELQKRHTRLMSIIFIGQVQKYQEPHELDGRKPSRRPLREAVLPSAQPEYLQFYSIYCQINSAE